jgi:hypothetical protein
MRPLLPRKIGSAIRTITATTWDQLVDCVAYAMDHPRGDGHHILYDAMSGMLKLNEHGVIGGPSIMEEKEAEVPYTDSAFSVKVNENTLVVNGGWISMNGECVEVPGATFPLKNCTISVQATFYKESYDPGLTTGPVSSGYHSATIATCTEYYRNANGEIATNGEAHLSERYIHMDRLYPAMPIFIGSARCEYDRNNKNTGIR